MTDRLDIYSDGSFAGRSGRGGWAFVVFKGDLLFHSANGSEPVPSNNTAEVVAAVEAMLWIEANAAGRAVTLWTDSNHVFEGCHRYRAIWRNNGWKRIDPNPRNRRRPIPDAELWRRLDELLDRNLSVSVELCKGHSGQKGNELADALARSAGFS